MNRPRWTEETSCSQVPHLAYYNTLYGSISQSNPCVYRQTANHRWSSSRICMVESKRLVKRLLFCIYFYFNAILCIQIYAAGRFLWNVETWFSLWYFFQDSLINKKFKRTVFIQNINFVLKHAVLFKSLGSVFFFLKKLIFLFSKDVLNG